jgi:sec-independent protein translocase protein TatA
MFRVFNAESAQSQDPNRQFQKIELLCVALIHRQFSVFKSNQSRYKEKTMFGLSAGHLIILFVVVLLFGSRRLPELGSALGRGIRGFKEGLDGKNASSPKIESKDQA